MKTIINKQTSVSYYKGENLLLTPSGASNGEWFDQDCTTANCDLVTCQDVPTDWAGGHYTYAEGVWARTALGEAAHAASLAAASRHNHWIMEIGLTETWVFSTPPMFRSGPRTFGVYWKGSKSSGSQVKAGKKRSAVPWLAARPGST
jgi:hypothetical protein